MFSTPFSSPDNPRTAALVGAAIGILGGVLALLIVLLEPVMAFGLVIGLAVGLYVLTDLHGALYVMIGVIALRPFGTLPFEIAVTPTLLDAALGGFCCVRHAVDDRPAAAVPPTPVTPLVPRFILLMIFAFRWACATPDDPTRAAHVLEMVLSLLLIRFW